MRRGNPQRSVQRFNGSTSCHRRWLGLFLSYPGNPSRNSQEAEVLSLWAEYRPIPQSLAYLPWPSWWYGAILIVTCLVKTVDVDGMVTDVPGVGGVVVVLGLKMILISCK